MAFYQVILKRYLSFNVDGSAKIGKTSGLIFCALLKNSGTRAGIVDAVFLEPPDKDFLQGHQGAKEKGKKSSAGKEGDDRHDSAYAPTRLRKTARELNFHYPGRRGCLCEYGR